MDVVPVITMQPFYHIDVVDGGLPPPAQPPQKRTPHFADVSEAVWQMVWVKCQTVHGGPPAEQRQHQFQAIHRRTAEAGSFDLF